MTHGYPSSPSVTLTAMSELAGLAEVAALLGVSKRTVKNYRDRADFPKPIEELASGPVWLRSDVQAWADTHLPLPPGRPRRDPA